MEREVEIAASVPKATASPRALTAHFTFPSPARGACQGRGCAGRRPGRVACRAPAEPGPGRAGLPSFRRLRRVRPAAPGRGGISRLEREKVVAALRSRGLDAEVEPVRPVPLGRRRRAALALARGKTGMALGYRRGRSHELIDIAVCPVLSPGIVARLSKLKP